MNFNRLTYRLSGPALLAGLLVISLLCGCRHCIDPVLAKADSLMEEHPDSALMLLDGYRLTSEASKSDSAYYALLLTHARYKNYIDETDDSLISTSADYFLDNGDDEKASRTLFLKGMILMNANHLGEAAVSFRQGLDIAHEGNHYMWEGQCARGLFMLYGVLLDGSSQVEYAKRAYEAFCKAEDEGWKSYSKLELARTNNNNCKYEKSLSILDELLDDVSVRLDTFLLAEIYQLKGLSTFGLARYQESIDNYAKACEFNPEILNEKDKRVIKVAIHESYRDSTPSSIEWLSDKVNVSKVSADPFEVLADEGRYEDAYKSLERYKNQQDRVLKTIVRNNVSESVSQYDMLKNLKSRQRVQNERIGYWTILLVVALIFTVMIWCLREKMHKEENLRLKAEADLESLRSDFMSQLETFRKKPNNQAETEKKETIMDYEKIIRQKYAEANRLCDYYYQGGINKDDNSQFEREVNNIVKNFTEKSSFDKIAEYVDEVSGGLFSSFRNDFFDLNEENFRLFLYLMLGFNSRSISVLIGQKVSAVYNRKARLKATIINSNVSEKETYLRFFGK